MSKVTIAIDDTNPALVAAFGENSLSTIADEFGYMEMVEKEESELPAKEPYTFTDPATGEEITSERYPEGTEMYKPNPESRANFVGRKMLENEIVPALIRGLSDRKRKEALANVDQEIEQAKDVLKNVAVVETV